MNSQHGFGLITNLIAFGVILAMIGGAWLVIDRKCWTTACHKQETRADLAEELLEVARKRATDLALLWARELNNVKERYVTVEKVRIQRFTVIRERIGKIEMAACPIPNDAALLLRDIERAANTPSASTLAGASLEPEAPLPVSPGWLSFAAAAGEAYRERDDGRLECIAQYNAVRDSIIKMLGLDP